MSILSASEAIQLPGRVGLSYIEQGDRDGIPLILLHGLTDSMRSYEPILAHLPDHVHAFALTQRGHGDADKPADGYGASDFAGDVVAFMDAIGIERAVVAGHSMGSLVGARVAVEHPERTLGLVLAGAFATFRDRTDLVELLDGFRALSDPVDRAFVRDWQESTLAQPVPAAFLETILDESGKLPARVWRSVLEAIIEERAEAFDSIRVPTLLVWGDQDAFVPRSDQDVMAAAIPDASLIVYAGAGHALHWEQPERFAADLARFASSVAAWLREGRADRAQR